MSGSRVRLARAVVASVIGILSCTGVNAQTSPASSAYSPQILPFPFPMYMGNASGLSPTDAAALGTSGNQSGNIFNNPMAAPFIYSSMFPMQSGTGMTSGGGLSGMATNQLGLMMMANQQMGGIGSGQLSGVRPGPKGQSHSKTGKPEDSQTHRTVSQPAGLAARYFNRTTIVSNKPRVFYNRPSSHYPQAPH